MAATRQPTLVQGTGAVPSPDELRSLSPLIRLITGVWTLSSVSKIGVSSDSRVLEVWAFMRDENAEDEARIWDFERQYRNSVGAYPFELHVIPLDQIDEETLPPVETPLDRSRSSGP